MNNLIIRSTSITFSILSGILGLMGIIQYVYGGANLCNVDTNLVQLSCAIILALVVVANEVLVQHSSLAIMNGKRYFGFVFILSISISVAMTGGGIKLFTSQVSKSESYSKVYDIDSIKEKYDDRIESVENTINQVSSSAAEKGQLYYRSVKERIASLESKVVDLKSARDAEIYNLEAKNTVSKASNTKVKDVYFQIAGVVSCVITLMILALAYVSSKLTIVSKESPIQDLVNVSIKTRNVINRHAKAEFLNHIDLSVLSKDAYFQKKNGKYLKIMELLVFEALSYSEVMRRTGIAKSQIQQIVKKAKKLCL